MCSYMIKLVKMISCLQMDDYYAGTLIPVAVFYRIFALMVAVFGSTRFRLTLGWVISGVVVYHIGYALCN